MCEHSTLTLLTQWLNAWAGGNVDDAYHGRGTYARTIQVARDAHAAKQELARLQRIERELDASNVPD